jgi:hypothetical protein
LVPLSTARGNTSDLWSVASSSLSSAVLEAKARLDPKKRRVDCYPVSWSLLALLGYVFLQANAIHLLRAYNYRDHFNRVSRPQNGCERLYSRPPLVNKIDTDSGIPESSIFDLLHDVDFLATVLKGDYDVGGKHGLNLGEPIVNDLTSVVSLFLNAIWATSKTNF